MATKSANSRFHISWRCLSWFVRLLTPRCSLVSSSFISPVDSCLGRAFRSPNSSEDRRSAGCLLVQSARCLRFGACSRSHLLAKARRHRSIRHADSWFEDRTDSCETQCTSAPPPRSPAQHSFINRGPFWFLPGCFFWRRTSSSSRTRNQLYGALSAKNMKRIAFKWTDGWSEARHRVHRKW